MADSGKGGILLVSQRAAAKQQAVSREREGKSRDVGETKR